MSFRSLLNRLVPGGSKPVGEVWGAPRVLDRGRVGRPQVAMDDQGNALAAWHHQGEDQEGVYICRYRADQRSWDVVPRRLDAARTQAHAPEIAMNHHGELAVVWHEQEDSMARICARHMLGSAGTWVPYPMTLQTTPGQVHSLHAAMDLQGNIHLLWCVGAPGDYRVYTTGYAMEEGAWDSAPTQLGQPSALPVYPQLAVNEAGHGLAVWSTDGAEEGDRLVACHFDPGGRCWSDRPTLVAPGRAEYLRMDMDARGNAIVLWVDEGRGGIKALHASHFDARSLEWVQAPLISSGRALLWPQIGLDDQGRAHAVWRQEVTGAMKLFTKRFTGGRWDDQRTLLVEDLGQSQAHSLSVNAQGHALVLWLQNQDAQTTVCVRRFDGTAWSARPVLLGSPGRKDVQNPGAVLSPSGHVAVIWRYGDAADGVILSAVGQA